ncbi:hypothetical protein ADM96_37510 [Burkholderia sp. ST111]|nr:hypothetical protein ADM96_37510 [Burkholderia sp. ST111]
MTERAEKMYTEGLHSTQFEWSEAALALLRDLLPLMSPVLQHSGWNEEECETLVTLSSASSRSSESVLLLTAYGQLWDAELVVRSVIEGSLKFAYLLQRVETFKSRHAEYAEDLVDISFLKDHQKATQLLGAVGNPIDKEWAPIRDMLLPDAEREAITMRFPKAARQRLESIWGFAGLIAALAYSGDKAFSSFTGFAHGYSISSHILHADYVGVALPMERDRRPTQRQESVHLTHVTRLISDVLACLRLRLMIGYRFIGHDTTVLADVAQRIGELSARFEPTRDQWLDLEYGPDFGHAPD